MKKRTDSRKHRYARLVARRKQCHVCRGLTNPSGVRRGCFDSDHIGPWSRWQGNLFAELLLVGQDWGDTACFRKNEGLDQEHNPTNQTLVELLDSIGISIGPAGSDDSQDVAFFTNAILCLKKGGLQGKVRREWFENCAKRFLRQQVEIISPIVVVTLGAEALRAVRAAFELPRMDLKTAVSDKVGEILTGKSRLLATYHPGRRVLNTHRSMKQQLKDWKRIEQVLRSASE